jgi:hypothetical protein
MNALVALLDDPLDFGKPQFTAIILLESASRDKPQVVRHEHECFQHRSIDDVKRAVYKDASAASRLSHAEGEDPSLAGRTESL